MVLLLTTETFFWLSCHTRMLFLCRAVTRTSGLKTILCRAVDFMGAFLVELSHPLLLVFLQIIFLLSFANKRFCYCFFLFVRFK